MTLLAVVIDYTRVRAGVKCAMARGRWCQMSSPAVERGDQAVCRAERQAQRARVFERVNGLLKFAFVDAGSRQSGSERWQPRRAARLPPHRVPADSARTSGHPHAHSPRSAAGYSRSMPDRDAMREPHEFPPSADAFSGSRWIIVSSQADAERELKHRVDFDRTHQNDDRRSQAARSTATGKSGRPSAASS